MFDALRPYQVQIFGFVSAVVMILIAEAFVRHFLHKGEKVSPELKGARPLVGYIRNILIVICLIGFGWAALQAVAQNEIPRKDLDRSGLQDQINKDR